MVVLWMYLFIVSFCIQSAFWIGIFSKIGFHRNSVFSSESPFVSIVICAKNEYSNLKKHLPFVLAQDYPGFEVIVVDDHSEDRTLCLLEGMAKKNLRLKVLSLEGGKSGKKEALTAGIFAATGQWIGLTDADCCPSTNQWICHMMRSCGNSDLILGYGPYRKTSGFLNAFIRYETWYVAIQYLSLAIMNMPYMAVGRNLFYKKNLFLLAGGLDSHRGLLSGDDDLFVIKASKLGVLSVQYGPPSYTISEPKKTLPGFIRQKARHVSTATYYDLKRKGFLAILFLSHFSLYLSLFILLFYFGEIKWFFGYILFLVNMAAVTWFNEKKLEEKSNFWYNNLFHFLLLPFYLWISFFLLKPKRTW